MIRGKCSISSWIHRAQGYLLLLACILAAFLQTGCTARLQNSDNESPKIAVIAKMADVDFWQSVRQGAESASKEFDVTLTFLAPEKEEDIDVQIALVRQAISDKNNALVLAASDYERLVDVTEEAVSAGIPVIVIDSEVHTERISSFIATDNRDAGTRVGEQLVERVGSSVDIAIMNFVKGSAPADQREAGFLSVMEQHPDIRILDTLYCKSDTGLSETLTRALLQKHPELDAIAALNAMSAIGVARAVSQAGLSGEVAVITMDNALEQIEFIEEGTIVATVVQNPFAMGYFGVKTALQVLQGEKVPAFIDTGSTVIDLENLYTPENQKLLFPFVR